jgi:hypothetical protein
MGLALSPSTRIFGAARSGTLPVRGILPLDWRVSCLFGVLMERNFEKVRVFTSQEPNSRFTIRAAEWILHMAKSPRGMTPF